MASTKPRFGGGIIMEHNKIYKTTTTMEQRSSKMEWEDKKPLETSSIPLTETDITNDFVEQYQCLSISPSTETQKFATVAVCKTGCDLSSQTPKEITQCFGLSSSSTQKVEDNSDEAQAQNFVSKTNEEELESSVIDVKYDSQTNTALSEDGSCQLNQLLSVFKTLGINRRPRMYTRLNKGQNPLLNGQAHNGDIISCDQNPPQILCSQLSHCCQHPFEENENVIYCKNLFVKDKKKQFYIIIAEESCTIDLKQLKTQLNVSRNLSFAQNDDLYNILQLRPGEITPFAVMKKSAKNVRVIFHESLSFVKNFDRDVLMAFHPFSPLLQVDITFSELDTFVSQFGKKLEILGHTDNPNVPEAQNVASASLFLKEFNNSNNVTEFPPDIPVNVDKTRKKNRNIRMQVGERKGKLKSYVKNHVKSEINAEEHDVDENQRQRNPAAEDKKPENTTIQLDPDEEVNKRRIDNNDSSRIEGVKCVNLDQLQDPVKKLPEVTIFYNTLKENNTIFREIDVSSVTSRDIGPSLGVRCYLLKDRRQNYFLIISHEFYELDYGRLKKSLQPKKKLDECNESDLLHALGVDCEHFTPFSAMNQRAKCNEIKVFFTEKIISPNVILCIQHPFAQGRRLIMKSSELQRLLASCSYEDSVGKVEEKVWHRRFDRPFSQFEYVHENDGTVCGNQLSHDCKAKVSVIRNQNPEIHRANCQRSQGAGNNESTASTNPSLDDNSDSKGRRDIHEIDYKHLSKVQLTSILTRCMDVVFRPLRIIPTLLSSRMQTNNMTEIIIGSYTESSADGKDFDDRGKITTRCSIQPFNSSNEYGPILKYDSKSKSKDNRNKELDYLQNKSLHQTKLKSGVPRQNNGSKLPLRRIANRSNRHENAITIHEIEEHLLLNDINFTIIAKHGNDAEEEENDDDENGTSQVCSTMYMTDEMFNHYIVVGREEEHVSVKRFCRRFHIRNKLYLDDEEDDDDINTPGQSLRTPFEIFLSSSRSNRGSNNHIFRLSDRHEFKMILFSSIYMESDMTCILALDKIGTNLLISAQELEKYAKKVGMEVWYMP